MINMSINRLKAIPRKRLYVFGAVSLVVMGIALLLALKLSPWLYATNVHVRLNMQAPAETSINICWDKTQIECLPLVPYLSAEKRIAEEGEIADLWLSELPPRPMYTLSLVFKSKAVKGIFRSLELNSFPGTLWGRIPGAGVQNTELGVDQFESKKITYRIQGGLYSLEGISGSRLIANQEVKPGPSGPHYGTTVLTIWSLLFSIYLLFAVPLYLLPFAIQNVGGAVSNDRLPRYPWWAYILCGMVILLISLLALNSPVMLDATDQLVYLHVALRQAWFFYPPRPPGYYMFVALTLWLSNYNLTGIVLFQVIFLVLSATICIWALRRWLHPLVAALVLFGILFSPVQVHWAFSIMRESIFVSLMLLGVAAAIAHFTTPDKVAARIWLAIFTIVCALAISIRENGILLPVVLLPVLLPRVLKYLNSPGALWTRIQSLFLMLVPYAAPVLATAIVYFGLSSYNYFNYGYFQFTTHATSHNIFWRQITTANFDSRGLLEADPSMNEEAKTYLGQQLYRSFVLAGHERPGADPIYVSIFPTLNQITSQKGQAVNWFHSASIIDEIGKSSSKLVNWKSELVGILRQYREFLVSNPADGGGYPLLPDDPTGLANKQQLLKAMERSIKYDGKPVEPDSILGGYYDLADGYGWYRPLFFLALLFSLYLLRYDDPIFLAPIVLFIANALLILMLRFMLARFIECLDVLLVLQMGLGFSRLIYRHSLVLVEKFHLSSFPEK